MTTSDGDRRRLRETFDRASRLYHQARPGYPEALLRHLLSVTGLRPDSRLLVIGCATGKATLPLARRGFAIDCVEVGPALADVARRNLLNTFSGHIAMEAWQRERLYGEVRERLSHRSDRRLRRHWGAVLHVARRCG